MDANSEGGESLEAKGPLTPTAENASLILGNRCTSPQKRSAEVTSSLCTPDTFKSPMNFSTVTVEQLGITPQSFVKNSAGKTLSSLKKSRRRSTIGARGSPETNHLIRFIAQQRSLKNTEKSPLLLNSPFQHSPGLYRNVNSLRERMSAFQSAFHSIKENEKMTDLPKFSEVKGDFEITDSAKKKSIDKCPQYELPAKLLSKRRRISSHSNSCENLTDAALGLQIFNIASAPNTDKTCAVETSLPGFPEKFSETCLSQSGSLAEESVPLSDITEASLGIKVANCVESKESSGAVEVSTDTAPEIRSLFSTLYKREIPPSETFVLRSVLKKPSVKACVESLQEHRDNFCEDGTHPNLTSKLTNCCKERKTGQESFKEPTSLNMKKRKRVTFGEDLSPEVFDESLPANTPLRKGGTPVSRKDVSAASPLPPDQSPVALPLPQPNFDDDDDKEENLENIEPLQESFAVLSPLNKSSASETLSGTDVINSSNNHENKSSHKVGRVTRPSNRRNQLVGFTEESACNLQNTTQPCKEKKVKRKKSQESKRTDKALPKKNQVLKTGRKKKGRGKKAVQKSLYGEREIASKKPLLSPIPELPEFSELTPSVPGTQSTCLDNVNSDSELEEGNITERKNLWPESPDLQLYQGFTECDVSEACSLCIKSSSSSSTSTSDQDTHINAKKVYENQKLPKAEIKLESENEVETGTEKESNAISCNSVMAPHTVAYDPKPDYLRESQEFSATGQLVKNLLQRSEGINVRCKEKVDILGSREEKLQARHSMPNSLKENDCSDGVLISSIKESQSEDLGKAATENSSGVSSRERKQRRRSMCHPDTQRIHLDKSGNRQSSVSSSIENGLENCDLYRDLSDAIEQTFQRTNRETKVRRSTRLQKDLENEGLVWISLPFSSASCTAPQNKRRTICAFDHKGMESLSPRKEMVSSKQTARVPPSIPGKENNKGKKNREGFAAASSSVPGRRRRSFCTSTLANTRNPTRSQPSKEEPF
ncbi:cell division cycle-associated protein 2 isoform X2 [Erinaceus europaeus]|uniref:Cell division cycle-associated protein 2 isoform X2 n=1 Tax=Erinaceus europaeus TaxID=9365 RepID=A0ABM3WE34_ERIEU|nr:cell division cycle-associated protein 2 isoform X2 [Erinaceus europaeus]